MNSLIEELDRAQDELVEITKALVRIPSETPPSDTREVANAVVDYLAGLENVTTSLHPSETPIQNLVAITKGNGSGKRLVLNGHLDTYPAGDHATWTDNPFSGVEREGKIFGRGSADMKGGIACALVAFKCMARHPELWSGELVLTLAGDEESMGLLGSQFLLDTVPMARGDAMLCADVGSPLVPRIGEKGMIWIDVHAVGRPAHGAHVHRGLNAIDEMRAAMNALSGLTEYVVETPSDVAAVVASAKSVSEPLGGQGEADVLQKITVNFGRIAGGISANLVADQAVLNADIRLPMGVSVAQVEAEITRLLSPMTNVTFEVVRRYEPTWTSPNDPIVGAVKSACRDVLGQQPVVNMRVGGSDARLYRAAGIPTVVCGLTPHNLGGPDEFVDIDELVVVAKIQACTALNFLS